MNDDFDQEILDRLAQIDQRLANIEADIAETKRLAEMVQNAAGPVIDTMKNSPMLKMFGGL